MLNAREPKIVNGPQILDKYVGESEANVRRLFAEAEEEEKRVTIESVIMFFILKRTLNHSLAWPEQWSTHNYFRRNRCNL